VLQQNPDANPEVVEMLLLEGDEKPSPPSRGEQSGAKGKNILDSSSDVLYS
jgi:hypothetical protein